MKYASRIKPISYLKANAARVVRGLAEGGEPLIITQNGEATAVIQDIASYEQTQEILAMLKILALGEQQVKEGKTVSTAAAMRRFREQVKRTKVGTRAGE
ncbi:MAG: type II toxin-antitoxin system Phd/YefM family antitoxin [Alphaproteobacteria bacterium]|nr:type II toxin-antitoxin system Phd/YefM family antitoxin [Alphaproteobacteria bacterium]